MDSELRLNAVMRTLLLRMLETIDEADFYDPLTGGGNSPGWILGHLVGVNRFGHSMLGGPGPSAEEMKLFGPGSSPILDAAACPSKAELLEAEAQSAAALVKAVGVADAGTLDSPQQSPFLQQEFPRVRDMLAHILVSHLSMHIGQLSAWRRSRSMPPILEV